jgi:nucleoside-diphosphate-sugar epimerase
VLGLARSEAAAEALAKAGVAAQRGELADLDTLIAGARACDGVIHTAFIHDFSRYAENAEIDRRAVTAMTDAMEGTGKPFVLTSGTAMIAPGRPVTEEDAPGRDGPASLRGATETVVEAAAERGVRGAIVRLPQVHGRGDRGFVPMLIDVARRTGLAAYVGDGANRWPAVHRLDAARLYVLALEKAAPGARLHAVAEDGVTQRAIAEVIGEGLGVPVRSIAADQALAHFGWIGGFASIDNVASSAITRETLGWRPQEIDLLSDMRESGYFPEAAVRSPAG